MTDDSSTLKDLFLEAKQMNKVEETLKQRGKTYGLFTDNAMLCQRLKVAIRTAIHWQDKELEPDQIEALEMICHKISRIVNGDADYVDNWHDIAGYATLVADRLQADEYQRSELISNQNHGGTD